MEQAGCRSPAFDRHVQGFEGQVPIIGRAHRPAHDVSREQIDDRVQVDLAARADHKFGGVADPSLIGRVGGKRARQHVVGDRLIVIAQRRVLVPTTHARDQSFLSHQTCDALSTDALLPLDEVVVDARTPVIASALREGRLNQRLQSAVFPRMRRFRARLPGIEPTGAHVKIAAQGREGEGGLLCGDPGDLYA